MVSELSPTWKWETEHCAKNQGTCKKGRYIVKYLAFLLVLFCKVTMLLCYKCTVLTNNVTVLTNLSIALYY